MTLDNPVLAGRMKSQPRRSIYERRALVVGRPRLVTEMRIPTKPQANSEPSKPKKAVFTRPPLTASKASQPHAPRTSRSKVLMRGITQHPTSRRATGKKRSSLRAKSLTALAVLLFLFGIGVGVTGLRTNSKVAAQVKHLQVASDTGSGNGTGNAAVPSEGATPSVGSYQVAGDLARTITIPKLNVYARVLQVGVNSKNELGTPNNIYDTAWYTGSSKPGQPGATLIDGHVSGPTHNGVFYGLKTLQPGDKIQIARGDGTVLHYTVVTSKTYDADNVDMAAALTPITAGESGLNLITCTGKVNSTNNGFLSRLVVFASQD